MQETVRCNDSSITFTIDDATLEVTQIDVVAGRRPVTIELLANDDSVKASVTVLAQTTASRPIVKALRVTAVDNDIIRLDGSTKHVRSFRHRVRW